MGNFRDVGWCWTITATVTFFALLMSALVS